MSSSCNITIKPQVSNPISPWPLRGSAKLQHKCPSTFFSPLSINKWLFWLQDSQLTCISLFLLCDWGRGWWWGAGHGEGPAVWVLTALLFLTLPPSIVWHSSGPVHVNAAHQVHSLPPTADGGCPISRTPIIHLQMSSWAPPTAHSTGVDGGWGWEPGYP